MSQDVSNVQRCRFKKIPFARNSFVTSKKPKEIFRIFKPKSFFVFFSELVFQSLW